jgi:hypothetical protein
MVAEFNKMGASRELTLAEGALKKQLFSSLPWWLDNTIKFSINTMPSLLAGFLATAVAFEHFSLGIGIFDTIGSFAFLAPFGFTIALSLVAISSVINTGIRWADNWDVIKGGNLVADTFYVVAMCGLAVCAGVALLASNPVGWFIGLGCIISAVISKYYDHRHPIKSIYDQDVTTLSEEATSCRNEEHQVSHIKTNSLGTSISLVNSISGITLTLFGQSTNEVKEDQKLTEINSQVTNQGNGISPSSALDPSPIPQLASS